MEKRIGLIIEVEGVDQANARIASSSTSFTNLGNAAGAAAVKVTNATKSAESGAKSVDKISDSADKASQSLEDVGKAGERSSKGIKSTGDASRQASRDLDQARVYAQTLAERLHTLRTTIDSNYASSTKLAQGTVTLRQAYEAGLITQERYDTSLVQLQKHIDETDRNTKNLANSSGIASGMISRLVVAVGGFLSLRALGGISDEYTRFTGQLKLATDSSDQFRQAQANVIAISRRAQTDIAGTGTLYARLNNALREMGATQSQVSDITETVALSLRVSGATAMESASAMLQLSQAFGSGVLRGEEFNAIAEAAPGLLRALAQAINVPVSALREMASNGLLTSDVLANAFKDPRLLASLREQAKEMRTVGSAWQVMMDNITRRIGELDRATGAGQAVANTMLLIADNLDVVAVAGVSVAAGLAAFYAPAVITGLATVATGIRTISLAMLGPVGLVVGLTAAAAGFLMMRDKAVPALDQVIAKQKELQALRDAKPNAKGDDPFAAQELNLSNLIKTQDEFIRQRAVLVAHQEKYKGTLFQDPNSVLRLADQRKMIDLNQKIEASILSIAKAEKDLAELRSQGSNSQLKPQDKRFAQLTSELKTAADAAKEYQEQVKAITEAAQREGISQDVLSAKLEVLKDKYDKATGSKKLATEAANKISNSYDSIINKSQDLVTSMRYEIEQGEQLSQGQKTINEINELLAKGVGHLTGEQRKLLGTYAEQIAALEGVTRAEQAKAERMALFAEAQRIQLVEQQAYKASLDATTRSIDQMVEAAYKEAQTIKMQVDTLTLGAAAVARIEQARLADAAAAYDQAAAIMKVNGEAPATIAYAEEMARKLRLLAEARQKVAGQNSILEGIKTAKKAQEDMVQQAIRDHDVINRSLTDSLLRGFESGKTFAENFRDTVKNMFSTLILRPVIQAVMSPVSNMLGQVFMGNGSMTSANGATGASGGTNWMGAAKSIWDAKSGNSMSQNLMGTVGGWLGNISTMVGSQSLGQFASGVAGKMVGTAAGMGPTAAGSATGIGAMSSGWGAAGAMAAKAMPWVGAAIQALSGDVKGAAWTAAGAAIGSIIPGIGTAIGAVIGSLIGSIVGKKSPKKYGSTASTTWEGGAVTGATSGNLGRALGLSSGLGGLNEAFSASLGGLLSEFGLSDRINSTSNMTARTNVRGDFSASFDGGSVYYGNKFGKTKRVDLNAAFQLMVDTVMGSVLSEAIQKSKLPEGIRALFSGITDRAKVAEMIDASVALNNANEQLADRFGLTVDAAAKVSKQTGYTGDDLTKFVNELATTANAFKTQGQQLIEARDNLTANVEAYSGAAALPSTLDAFDALLKSIDTTTQEGIEKFTALFGIRTGFTEFTKAMDTLKANVDTSIYSMLSPSEQLAKNQAELAKQFGALNIAVPGSIDELIKMGTNIDYTTEAGLNLAAAFPGLVQGFMTIRDQTDQLTSSMNAFDADKFSSLFDWQMYRGVATNSSIDKANSLLGVPGFASGGTHSGGWRIVGENGPELEYTGPSRIFSNEQSTRMLSSGDNNSRQLEAELRDVKAILVQILKHNQRSAETLEEWNDVGMPETQEART